MQLKLFFLISVILATVFCGKDTLEQLEELMNNDYAKKILKELGRAYQGMKNCKILGEQILVPLDTILILNSLEGELSANIEKDINFYQQVQQRSTEHWIYYLIQGIDNKQELKKSIYQSKYSIINMGEEITILENEVKFATDIKEQREQLQNLESEVLMKLNQISDEEEARMKKYNPDFDNSINFIQSVKDIIQKILEIEYSSDEEEKQLQGQKYLNKRRGSMPEVNKLSDYQIELRNIYDNATKKFKDNPYVKLIGSFLPVVTEENRSSFAIIFDILENLNLEIKENKEIIQSISAERIKYFTEEKSKLKYDQDKWNQELNTINPIAQQGREKLKQLQLSVDDEKYMLDDYQKRLDDLKKQNENYQYNYENGLKEQISNFSTLRVMKQAVYEGQEIFQEFIKKNFL